MGTVKLYLQTLGTKFSSLKLKRFLPLLIVLSLSLFLYQNHQHGALSLEIISLLIGSFIILPFTIFVPLVWLLSRRSTRAEALKGLCPSVFFLYGGIMVIYLITEGIKNYVDKTQTTQEFSWSQLIILAIPLVVTIILFGLSWLFPARWHATDAWWNYLTVGAFVLAFYQIYQILACYQIIIGTNLETIMSGIICPAMPGENDAQNTPNPIPWGPIALLATFTITFWFPWLLPVLWRGIEQVWWRLTLGGSPAVYMLRDYAFKEFELLIKQKQTDEGLPPQIAPLLAVNTRLLEFPGLHYRYKKRKDEDEKRMYNTNLKLLLKGWASEVAPVLLEDYMKAILKLSKGMDDQEKLRDQSAVASVKYLLGDISEATALAKKNWNPDENQAMNDDLILTWSASYAYFITKAFGLGDFDSAMNEMINYWHKHYSKKPWIEQKKILQASYFMPLNPVLSKPRNLILAAAFNGSPPYTAINGSPSDKKQAWPSRVQKWSDGTFEVIFKEDKLKSEWQWVQHWYKEAKNVCKTAEEHNKDEALISLSLSKAYTAFYYTLLCIDLQYETVAEDLKLDEKIKLIFQEEIREDVPIERHVKSGFYGIYKLAIEYRRASKNQKQDKAREALEYFRDAAKYSDFTGHRSAIIDCLFMCCHAVSAQRTGRDIEATRYLKEAERVAERIGLSGTEVYFDLCNAARAEIESLRGSSDLAKIIDDKIRESYKTKGRAGERIIRIFRENFPRRDEERGQTYKTSIRKIDIGDLIEKLNERWRSEAAPELLRDYMNKIMV